MSSLIAGQRSWSSATENCSWCIASRCFLRNVQSVLPTQRSAIRCLRSSKPFQNASISSNHKSTELLTPNAALIEPEMMTQHSTDCQISYLQDLVSRLRQIENYSVKINILLNEPDVKTFLTTAPGSVVFNHLPRLHPREAYALLCLPAIGQDHVITTLPLNGALVQGLDTLGTNLGLVEEFYDSIGGLVGYQLQCLLLIEEHKYGGATSSIEDATDGLAEDVEFMVPSGLDLSSESDSAAAAAATARGLLGLPNMAEIYPLGGAGDRLGLCCENSGESLPTAVLPYCGRSLLEALIRDLQAREYLYFKVTGAQLTTPVAVMTSSIKGNHWRVQQVFEKANWFGRGEENFKLFPQPLVPVLAAHDAKWLMSGPLQLIMKPGGHGVIWKLMLDAGVFDWLSASGRTAAIVRQISNPMAGQDTTLLALAGEGLRGNHAFGFASCERVVGAAEGMNVLLRQRLSSSSENKDQEEEEANNHHLHTYNSGNKKNASRYSYRVTNVEYTEFERLGIEDKGLSENSEHSAFPANTNVLFLGLPKIEAKIKEGVALGTTDAVLPGMILNLKKESVHIDVVTGVEKKCRAGRLECTMQNLADCFGTEILVENSSSVSKNPSSSVSSAFFINNGGDFSGYFNGDAGTGNGSEDMDDSEFHKSVSSSLDTFMVYGPRRKVTSSAKRQRTPGSLKIHQTPDGSLYDLLRNASDMMRLCNVEMPELGTVAEYLDSGPGFLFFFHPALGPLWSVVAQKIRGGKVGVRSEVQMEVAEVDIEGMDVEGSLLVIADNVLGHYEEKSVVEVSNGNRQQKTGIHNSEKKLVFSDRCGKLRLRNVTIRNKGIDWSHPDNVYWKHKVTRKEACRILLHGEAEFEAADVELRGDVTYEVPDGYKMTVTSGGVELTRLRDQKSILANENGYGKGNGQNQNQTPEPRPKKWSWNYSMPCSSSSSKDNSTIQLQLVD